jgi:hypothetical protein
VKVFRQRAAFKPLTLQIFNASVPALREILDVFLPQLILAFVEGGRLFFAFSFSQLRPEQTDDPTHKPIFDAQHEGNTVRLN